MVEVAAVSLIAMDVGIVGLRSAMCGYGKGNSGHMHDDVLAYLHACGSRQVSHSTT